MLDAAAVAELTASVNVMVVPPAMNAVVKPPDIEVVMTPSEAHEVVLPHMTVEEIDPPTICTLVVYDGASVLTDSADVATSDEALLVISGLLGAGKEIDGDGVPGEGVPGGVPG